MNYRVTSELELVLKVRACFPKETYASHAILKFPVPKLTSNVHTELPKVIYI